MNFAPELRTYAQKVCNLYKRAMRNYEAIYVARNIVRYHQVQLRAEFDKNANVCDPKEQRRLLWSGEHELFLNLYPLPCSKFPRSVGIAAGVAAGRESIPPDWVLDYWHPLEKARYPCYFYTREASKCQYKKLWDAGELY